MVGTINNPQCCLCGGRDSHNYFQDDRRNYWQCSDCDLVFVDPNQRLTPEQEKAEYDRHENSPQDAGYRRFLSRVQEPVLEYLAPGAQGLDFGCGPGPTLSLMFEERGFEMAIYDRFYADEPQVLKCPYDFITATEVVEHLFEPGVVIRRLWGQLREGGCLAMMTKLLIDKGAFSRWHYKNDQTHVCFFSRASFEYLARELNARLEFFGSDVILLRKL